MPESPTPSRNIAGQFAALALLWGASYLFIKVSLDGLSPAQVAVGRIVLGAACLSAIMLITGRAWPHGLRTWLSLTVSGIFLCVAPFLLYAWAGQFVASSISSIYNASLPVAALLIAIIVIPGERLTLARGVGVVVSVAGVALVTAAWDVPPGPNPGPANLAQVALLVANICFAIGFVLTRLLLSDQDCDKVSIAAGQIVSAAVVGLALSPFIDGFAPMRLTPPIVASMLALGLFGTGFAYILNNNIIAAWGASRAAGVSYLVPAVGVALGVVVLHEPLAWHEPIGGVLILAGVLVSRGPAARGGPQIDAA